MNPLTCQCENTAACDDGDPCTDDVCFPDGTCGNLVRCDDCDLDCNPYTAQCEPAADPVANCDDGNPYTGDCCVNGSCANQDAAACPDRPCHDVAVNPATCQCEYTPNCDDGSLCTDDLCNEYGVCVYVPRCPGCDQECDPSTGACRPAEFPWMDCDDGDPDTEDCCVGGTCLNRSASGCPARPCQDASVDPVTCACVYTGGGCDDGDPCTRDSCNALGECEYELIPDCCYTDDDCSDGCPCSIDECIDNRCVLTYIPDCDPGY